MIEVGDDDAVDAASVTKAIAALKESDPILFGETEESGNDQKGHGNGKQKPVVKPARATEGDTTGGYEKEVAAAKTHKELEAVARKYGKM